MQMERTKISKKQFGHKIVTMFGYENVYASKYSENSIEGKVIPMTLYYTKGKTDASGISGDKHIATWCQGEGWIF